MTDDGELTTCSVTNKHDNQSMTLCTQWLEWGLKINVFTTDSIALTGQLKTADIDTFATNLSKTRFEYLELTRSVLSGKDESIEYIMKDSKLRWKKGLWNYGMVDMAAERLEEIFPDLLNKFLLRHAKLEESLDTMNRKNEELREAKSQLDQKLEDVIELKNEFERDIYKRFILVLNSKKKKIRELSEELNKKRAINERDDTARVYEAETEDSEDSGSEEGEGAVKKNEKTTQGGGTNLKMFFNRNYEDEIEHRLIKRQISDSDGKMSDSECEEDRRVNKNCKYTDRKEAKPCTSKNNNYIDESKGDDRGKSSVNNNNKKDERSTINFDSDDSEKDMFA